MARSELVLPMAFASVKLKDFTRARLLLKEAEKNPSLDTDKISQVRDLLESGSRSSCAPVRYRSDCSAPRVSLCMIAKDEQQCISGCLESVYGLVDEIIVVDTGSTDRTEETARSCGAKVFSFPWKGNFAEARNESLRHATGDWIIFLDADERLNTFGVQDCLRKSASAQGVDAYAVPIINPRPDGKAHSTIVRAVRFFRNLPGIRFSGRVHESVDRFLTQSGTSICHADFEILHFGYALGPDIVRRKYERNLHLLKEELAEDPGNSNFRYHLGLTCMALEREEEARQAFDLALCGTRFDAEPRGYDP